MAIRRRVYAIRVLLVVYRKLIITFMFFFPHALYACNLLIYNNNVHIIYIIIICTRRRNARPVNINHIVTRSRTIIRSAAELSHGRRPWSAAWKIIFNVFRPTSRWWKTEKLIHPPPPNSHLPSPRFRVHIRHWSKPYNYIIMWCVPTILRSYYVSVYNADNCAQALFFTRHFSILPTAALNHSYNNTH